MTTERSTAWSITINNPTPADEEQIARARQNGWRVEGQLERGSEGTPHYQLMVKTPQIRFSAMKKAFPRAHIEAARNVAALQQYVNKEETREGDLPIAQERYPTAKAFYQLLYSYYEENNYLDHTATAHRVRWWSKETGRRTALELLDEAAEHWIANGYFVETMVVNPQFRSAWDKFHAAILYRAYVDRETDRQRVQSAEDNISTENITNADQVHTQENAP